MRDDCKNCGAPEGLHHYQTNQCPRGGVESPFGKPQQWADTTFRPRTREDELIARIEKLEARINELIVEAEDRDRALRGEYAEE